MISFVLERRLIVYSGVVLIAAFILVFILGFYTGIVSSDSDSLHATSLPLPAVASVDVALVLPEPYVEPPAGEFIDVDLPDGQKSIEQITGQKAEHLADEKKPDTNELISLVSQHKQADSSFASVYSLQLGMFRDKDNALRMIDDLQSKQHKAYLFEAADPTGRLRYNVRSGQYHNRQRAENALAAYKANFTASAYIVIDCQAC